MARLSILAICAAALLAAGCGGSDESTAADAGTTEATTAAAATTEAASSAQRKQGNRRNKRRARGKKIKVVGSQFGRVVADGRGEAFYLFDKEKGRRSQCYGACARAWPPVLTRGRPRAGRGAKARLLGVTRRKNGKLQVTYKGHPLYYYVDDRPGLILCQDVAEFGGLWLVVKPNGDPVT
ncbi:MAG TPA: hypothetical protein VFT19_06170 [Solirubrobacterales bacterium]|nr:hypothetical protein [Solirubrobacterales bacterium]